MSLSYKLVKFAHIFINFFQFKASVLILFYQLTYIKQSTGFIKNAFYISNIYTKEFKRKVGFFFFCYYY